MYQPIYNPIIMILISHTIETSRGPHMSIPDSNLSDSEIGIWIIIFLESVSRRNTPGNEEDSNSMDWKESAASSFWKAFSISTTLLNVSRSGYPYFYISCRELKDAHTNVRRRMFCSCALLADDAKEHCYAARPHIQLSEIMHSHL